MNATFTGHVLPWTGWILAGLLGAATMASPLLRAVGWPGADGSLRDLELPRITRFTAVSPEPGRNGVIVAEHEGAVALRADGLGVNFPGHTPFGIHPELAGGATLMAFGVALAEESPAGFRIVAEDVDVYPDRGQWLSEDGTLRSSVRRQSYELPGIRPEDLPGRWLVVIHRVRVPHPVVFEGATEPPEAVRTGALSRESWVQTPSLVTQYVHVDRGVFDELLTPAAWDR